MKKFPTRPAMKAKLGIYNSHHLCIKGGSKVYVEYSPYDTRSRSGGGWQVIGIGFSTDPPARWNYGRKIFRGIDSRSRQDTLDWAAQRYGIDEWVRDPWGAYQDVRVWERITEAMKR